MSSVASVKDRLKNKSRIHADANAAEGGSCLGRARQSVLGEERLAGQRPALEIKTVYRRLYRINQII